MNCQGRKYSKVKPNRKFDVCYDKIMCFPCDKDYFRERGKAFNATMSFSIQPDFDTMFSGCRQRLVAKQSFTLPSPHPTTSQEAIGGREIRRAVSGAKRPMYFRQPLRKVKAVVMAAEAMRMSSTLDVQEGPERTAALPSQHKMTQTDYRDSETQTLPWAHDVIATHKTELLQLGWLKVDPRVIITREQISQLERHWHKQAWEEVMPRLHILNKAEREVIARGLAVNSTNYQDDVIQTNVESRIALSAEKLAEKFQYDKEELQDRLLRLVCGIAENQSGTLVYLRKSLLRGLRKLKRQYFGNQNSKSTSGPVEKKSGRTGKGRREIKGISDQMKELEIIDRLTSSSRRFGSPKPVKRFAKEKEPCKRKKSIAEKIWSGFEETKNLKSSVLIKKNVRTETPGCGEVPDQLLEENQYATFLIRQLLGQAARMQMENELGLC